MMPKGSINAWKCDDCQQYTVCIHVDEGVTPMFLACRTTEGCQGMAVSIGYPDQLAIPKSFIRKIAWEWYRPTPKKARQMGREMQQHVAKGGLAVRPLTQAGKDALLK